MTKRSRAPAVAGGATGRGERVKRVMQGYNGRAVRVAASVLAADFANLGAQVGAAASAGCDWLHVDVMDGRFVPPISFGLPVLEALHRVSPLPLDVHLMIEEPERHVEAMVAAGADHVVVHVEATRHLHRVLQQIRGLGASPGVTLNPATPLHALDDVLGMVDQVLVMSVNPGYGGQRFIPQALARVTAVRQRIDALGLAVLVSVDGGVKAENASAVVSAGADVLVAGSAIFNGEASVADAVAAFRHAVSQAG